MGNDDLTKNTPPWLALAVLTTPGHRFHEIDERLKREGYPCGS